jgi:hypothetical protein
MGACQFRTAPKASIYSESSKQGDGGSSAVRVQHAFIVQKTASARLGALNTSPLSGWRLEQDQSRVTRTRCEQSGYIDLSFSPCIQTFDSGGTKNLSM